MASTFSDIYFNILNELDARLTKLTARSPAPAVLKFGYFTYFIFSFMTFLPYLRSNYAQLAEITMLAEARRVLQGEIPYRDFFSYIGFGNHYLIASIWRLCGIS